MKRKVMKNEVSTFLIISLSLILGSVFAFLSKVLFDMSFISVVVGVFAGWCLCLYIIEYLENK